MPFFVFHCCAFTMKRLFLIVAVGCLHLAVADNGQQWVTQDEFANRLPATLTPINSYTAQTSGECFVYCAMQNCSSVGYSSTYRSCKLYSHANLAKPLPTLAVDPTGYQHQMYYRKNFCPPGWETDAITGKCYYMDNTQQYRPNAWQVCEEHLMSEMVTFQTPYQRDYLYQLLVTKYANTTKWWTGYALFDSQLWPRPIDEIPGYRAYRGDCLGNNIATLTTSSHFDCALKCDRKYRDLCVGFSYSFTLATCWLKNKMCEINSNAYALGSEMWHYHKVHAGRPMTRTFGSDITSAMNVGNYNDISLWQCINYARKFPQAVHFSYYPTIRQCWIHYTTNTIKGACYWGYTDCVSFETKDISNDPWCPMGVRYRDVCLVYQRNTKDSFFNMQNWCRTQGGKFTRPIDGVRKASYTYGLSNPFVDLLELGHLGNWTSQYDGLTYANSLYNRWLWDAPSQPSNSNGWEHCANSWTTFQDTNGTYTKLNDCPCNTGDGSYYAYNALCEFPLSQTYPKDCRFTPLGREYMGRLGVTTSGAQCKQWSLTAYGNSSWRQFPDWYTTMPNCRSPDGTVFTQPWCYRQDTGAAETCNVPMCPESDWAPSQTYDAPEQPFAAISKTNTQADSYYWTVESISTQANALCQIDMKNWCPLYFRGSCYQQYKIPNNHAEGQAICAQNGWHLVSITTRDEQLFLMGVTMRLGEQWINLNYHIGLYWNTTTGSWAWESGEPYSQNFWQGGSPGNTGSGYCGQLWTMPSAGQGWWATLACSVKYWFICEIEIAG